MRQHDRPKPPEPETLEANIARIIDSVAEGLRYIIEVNVGEKGVDITLTLKGLEEGETLATDEIIAAIRTGIRGCGKIDLVTDSSSYSEKRGQFLGRINNALKIFEQAGIEANVQSFSPRTSEVVLNVTSAGHFIPDEVMSELKKLGINISFVFNRRRPGAL